MLTPLHGEPAPFPSRGVLRIADKLAFAVPVFIFGGGAMLSILAHGTRKAIVVGVCGFLLPAAAYVMRYQVVPTLSDRNVVRRFYRGLPGGLIGLVFGVSAAVTTLVTARLGMTELRFVLWPMFLPGLMLLIRSRSYRDQQPLPFLAPLSALTVTVLAYATAASAVIAWPARAVFLQACRQIAGGDGWIVSYHAGIMAANELVPVVWTATTLLVTYYLMRRSDIFRVQAALLFKVNEAFSKADDFIRALPEAAALLQRYLLYERIIILVPDFRYYDAMRAKREGDAEVDREMVTLTLAGVAQQGAGAADKVQPLRTIDVTLGSLPTEELRYVSDLTAQAEHLALGFEDARSQLEVPVFGHAERELAHAVIVVQDHKARAFTKRDEALIRQVRDYLAVYAQDSLRNPTVYYRDLQIELDRLIEVSDSYAALSAETTCSATRLFSTSHAAFVPLGLGNSVLLQEDVHPHTGLLADLVRRGPLSAEGPRLSACARHWKPLFVRRGASNGDPALTKWIESSELAALAVLPIGASLQRVGLLLVGFSDLPIAWFSTKANLLAFSQAVSPQLCAVAQAERVYGGFMKPTVDLHGLLAQEGLGRGRVTVWLQKPSTTGEVRSILAKVERVLQRAQVAEGARIPDFGSMTFEAGLKKFQGDLVQGHLDLRCNIDPEIDAHDTILKTVLYRLVTEAVINSLFHGNATEVKVHVSRSVDSILVEVNDNGVGFDCSQSGRPQGGMYQLTVNLRRFCGASEPDWTGTVPGEGTRLRITVPVLADIQSEEWQKVTQDH